MLPSRLKIEKCPSQREKAFPKFQISKISKISDFWKMANFRKNREFWKFSDSKIGLLALMRTLEVG